MLSNTNFGFKGNAVTTAHVRKLSDLSKVQAARRLPRYLAVNARERMHVTDFVVGVQQTSRQAWVGDKVHHHEITHHIQNGVSINAPRADRSLHRLKNACHHEGRQG